MDFGARMNVSNFGVKRSKVKVTVGLNMPQNPLFGLRVVTRWRHNSRRSRNHLLVLNVIDDTEIIIWYLNSIQFCLFFCVSVCHIQIPNWKIR